MGLKLIDRAFDAAALHNLTGQQTRLLLFIARTARDDDPEPRYWGGWRAAAHALGMQPDKSHNVRMPSGLMKAFSDLVNVRPPFAPLLIRLSAGHRGRNAVYLVNLPLLQNSHPNLRYQSAVERANAPTASRERYPRSGEMTPRNWVANYYNHDQDDASHRPPRRRRSLTGSRRLSQLTSSERATVDHALRGFGVVPPSLEAALEEARLEREHLM